MHFRASKAKMRRTLAIGDAKRCVDMIIMLTVGDAKAAWT